MSTDFSRLCSCAAKVADNHSMRTPTTNECCSSAVRRRQLKQCILAKAFSLMTCHLFPIVVNRSVVCQYCRCRAPPRSSNQHKSKQTCTPGTTIDSGAELLLRRLHFIGRTGTWSHYQHHYRLGLSFIRRQRHHLSTAAVLLKKNYSK